MRKLLAQIERRYFNGDRLKGERQAYIFRELARRGCDPKIDAHGNIWTMRGSGKPLVLFSSHMDVDPRISKRDMKLSRVGGGRVASGVLDNAVGCALNLLLAEKNPKKGSAIHVFTASEEIAAENPRIFARSARVVARSIKKLGLAPDMCVTIDVTYPELLAPHHKTDWSKADDELFFMMDKTHCYLDGYLDRRSKRLGFALVRKFGDKNVRVRNLPGHDETVAYGKLAPSFAFGPVVFGSFDRPGQTMPFSHMKTALRFLRFVAGQNCRKK